MPAKLVRNAPVAQADTVSAPDGATAANTKLLIRKEISYPRCCPPLSIRLFVSTFKLGAIHHWPEFDDVIGR